VRGAALAGGGALALAVASVSGWFSFDYRSGCGWTCYSPLPKGGKPIVLTAAPTNAFDGLGAVAGVALALVLVVAVLAIALARRGRRVPLALPILAAAGAIVVAVRTVTQPDLGPATRLLGDRLVHIEAAAYVGVAAALVAALGVAVLARASRLESPVA
jgi:hypothetical protein